MIKAMLCSFLAVCATLTAVPQAVVFDFGGVMTGEPNREAVVQFICTSMNLTQREFDSANQEKKKAVRAGKTDVEFWVQYAQSHNIMLPVSWQQDFLAAVKNAIGINDEMYILVDHLKEQNVVVALLSNIDERLGKMIRDFGLYAPFSPCLLSYEIGLEKPDPKIYEVLLTRMNLPAEEIIFIDDRSDNIDAAKNMGIDAILFISQEQLQHELEVRGLKA